MPKDFSRLRKMSSSPMPACDVTAPHNPACWLKKSCLDVKRKEALAGTPPPGAGCLVGPAGGKNMPKKGGKAQVSQSESAIGLGTAG